jgi:predicted GTPase
MKRRKAIIIGAAGRDFHNFNTCFRENRKYEVIAFTAAQIPDISDRAYPASLSGALYPEGIPILPEEELPQLIRKQNVRECFFSYSDVSYDHVMRLSAIVQAAGASFCLLGPDDTMIRSSKPVIAVCAVRTGCGKSPASRKILEILQHKQLRAVVIRHPMPYGNLDNQQVQRFAHLHDFEEQRCTIEEMEEYEPYVASGNVIYAGADYQAILKAAEQDVLGCDLILWDGGNNDFPFYRPDLQVTVVDPHRAGHELRYYPGEVNLRRADVVIINKVDSATQEGIDTVRRNAADIAPNARVIETALEISIDDPGIVMDKQVLVVEDGPTLTHGGMKTGAGTIAALRHGAAGLIDPRPFLVGKLKDTFEEYPDIGTLLPAMGYGEQQLADLEATINAAAFDAVVIGTPIDLGRLIDIKSPNTRVYYELKETSEGSLEAILDDFIENQRLK